jgi:hypothetical protein
MPVHFMTFLRWIGISNAQVNPPDQGILGFAQKVRFAQKVGSLPQK